MQENNTTHKKQSLADLHMHSTASDGGYPPEELMKKCINGKLEIVALTDHDTTSGVQVAKEIVEKHGIKFITGIELSTRFKGKSVDILGYGIDSRNEILLNKLSHQLQMRRERMVRMIEKCQEIGMPIHLKDVEKEAKGDTLSRPHLAQVMVNHQIVPNIKEAFNLYLTPGKPCYEVKEEEMTPQQAIQLIHQAGGIAVVAHPIFYSIDEDILRWVVEDGLDGIEVYHRDHDKDAIERFYALASEAEYKLGKRIFKTGGSDFHHESFGREGEIIGKTKLPFEEAEYLFDYITNKN
ncbi:PHP domain-containing protein [Evansella sp. AB-P1]|uniref:PHP domain-containing protein n=1 Tax=Evansella sp. AB-P1 TaxID=3037653 RepID=UPI00241FFC97|nr:PHP domain-containing protein [Evansella sp. AB-P1]MDG5789925.1 PHP domain-containing protein [Evansella sp. AB-P1]